MINKWEEESRKKIVSPLYLQKLVSLLKEKNRSIVTINGSFDVLHAGHLAILYEASLQADCLIVALNTDKSIQGYKSPSRPIVPLKYRLQMMAALSFVDYVTYFDETDPRTILSVIQPDVHVNDAEYGEECIESSVVKAYGGKLHIVKKVDGFSTTKLIEKIKSCD